MEEKNEMRKLADFREEPVQVITLDDLSKTHLENYPDGTPVGGIYHYALIQEILDILEENRLTYEVNDIFCANNKYRRSPGVTVLPAVEKEFGVGSLQSHILRRVFCNITLKEMKIDEKSGYNIAISYTQNGILVGFGPMVYACMNQTICCAESMLSNYTVRGMDRLTTEARKTDYLLLKMREKIQGISQQFDNDRLLVEKLKGSMLTLPDVQQFMGSLMMQHARSTTNDSLIYTHDFPPLNVAQLTCFAGKMINIEYNLRQHGENEISAWDVINAANHVYKPMLMPFENIVPQSLALSESMMYFLDNK